MYWQIEAPGMKVDIVEPKSFCQDDKFQEFSSQGETARFLEGFSSHWKNFDRMLAAIRSNGEPATSRSHQEVANQLARLIVSDRLRLRKSHSAEDKAFRGPFGMKLGVWMERKEVCQEETNQSDEKKAEIPAEDRITIRVVDDKTGKPVPGVLIDLQVPDGWIEHRETPEVGIVQSIGLQSGECVVSSSYEDLEPKNTLLFAGVGNKLAEKGDGIPPHEPGNRYNIVQVETHQVKQGETLKKVAQAAGVPWSDIAQFNWGNRAPKEFEFQHSDIVYIPKKWSQKGFMTNQSHKIRVNPFPLFLEDDIFKRAGVVDISLSEIKSDPVSSSDEETRQILEKGKAEALKHPTVVYLDIGCWVDAAHGGDEKCREFALVCGSHVYLCKYKDYPVTPPRSRVKSVQKFFDEMIRQGHSVEVLGYLCANTEARKLDEDSQLYLFLGDLHMPAHDVHYGSIPSAGNPDIFKHAGDSLVDFLFALSKFSDDIKRSLHFIQLGDMFELWVNRDYQFKPGDIGTPEWLTPESPQIVASWLKEVLGQNKHVMIAFEQLEKSGLAEVQYLWGNHDGYLQKPRLAQMLNLQPRQAVYSSPNGVLAVHGHQFDDKNFDNTPNRLLNRDGPVVTEHLYRWSAGRRVENLIRPNMRETYLSSTALTYLYQKCVTNELPFAIYIMAHTHDKYLCRLELID